MKNVFKFLTGTVALSAALTLFSTTASAAPSHHEAQRVVVQHVVHRPHHVVYRPHHVAYRPHHVNYRPHHRAHRSHYAESRSHYAARHHGYHRHVAHHYYR